MPRGFSAPIVPSTPMKHLAILCLLGLSLGLTSCALPAKLIQTPVRLLQAGVRTVTDVDEPSATPTTEADPTATRVATKLSEVIVDPGE